MEVYWWTIQQHLRSMSVSVCGPTHPWSVWSRLERAASKLPARTAPRIPASGPNLPTSSAAPQILRVRATYSKGWVTHFKVWFCVKIISTCRNPTATPVMVRWTTKTARRSKEKFFIFMFKKCIQAERKSYLLFQFFDKCCNSIFYILPVFDQANPIMLCIWFESVREAVGV